VFTKQRRFFLRTTQRWSIGWSCGFSGRFAACTILALTGFTLAFVPYGSSQQVTVAATPVAQSPADLVLTGEVTGAQQQTYLEVPFAVPAGVHRISVDFQYTGREQRATIDLGVADPQRFRGASGGNKSHFTIGEMDATPSYLPGAIVPGKWRLLLSVPNMRAQTVSRYRAEIRFNGREEDAGFTLHPLTAGKRWYRGDLHMHTAHSDGSCASQNGREVPCPLFLTVQTASARGLDFIAITDHNTDSHYNEMRELQPYFDKLLLIPGREMTTFRGHFNVFGVTEFMDWRVAQGELDLNSILRDARAKGGIASVNHAEAPTGEDCMGCGWDPAPGTDMNLFSSVEVINGGEIMFSSASFWDKQLRDGHRLAAVGGSDSHNATAPPGPPDSIGWPTTVAEADELSVPAILKAIRDGRTFIDLTASHDRTVDFDAGSGDASVSMGGTLRPAAGAPIQVRIHAAGVEGSLVHLLVDGEESASIPAMPAVSDDATVATRVTAGAGRHWLRVEVRDHAGMLQLVSSPLYINFPE
jgi:hypothetical protein